MVTEYTPTTGQVRQFWASEGTHVPAAKSEDYVVSAAEFDRWLAGVKADAFNEGLTIGICAQSYVPNPYESEEDRHVDQ